MSVNRNLLNEFVKITNDNKKSKTEKVYGTIVSEGDARYVKIDGSDIKTPFTTTAEINNNERVIVSIDNHRVTVTGNLSDPSVGGNRVEGMEGSIGHFDHLFAGNITAENIKANSITTDKLMAGSVTADKIATGAITAGSGIIADGAIGNAQITNLDAAKIVSGTIDTSDVTIAGADGVLRIKDNRLQVFDGMGLQQVERVSLGDVNGDGTIFGLRVRGADGETILLDENGVTEEGITDGSISNDKINPNAGIEGGKLDIDSVIDTINKDGSKTINSVRIDVDSKSLSAVVQEIKDKSNEQDTRIRTNTAEIKANKDSIKMKVDEQTYETDKENMNTQFEKHTTEINLLKDEMSLKVESTDIENAITDNNKVVDSKIETVKSEIKLTTDSITSKVEHMEMNTAKNLLMNTNFASDANKTENWGMWTNAGDAGGWYKHQHEPFPLGEGIGVFVHKADKATEIQSKTIRVAKGETYTLSAFVNVERNVRSAVIVFREFKKDGTWFNAGEHIVSTNFNEVGSWTHTVRGEETTAMQILFVNNGPFSDMSAYTVLFINRVQLERGSKASEWHLGHMDTLTSKFSEIKQTTDSITSTVSDVQNGQSQLTQRVDGFEFKVDSAGRFNMLRNSDFVHDLRGWGVNDCWITDGFSGAPKTKGVVIGDCSGFNQTRWINQYLDIRNNSTGAYTISGYYYKTSDTHLLYGDGKEYPMCNVYMQIQYTDNTVDYYNYTIINDIPPDKWTKVECTFVNQKPLKSVEFYLYKRNCTGVFYATQLKVEEGWGASNWSPSPNEVRSGVTTIDGIGVQVTHDSGDYTQMTSQGLKRHRSNGDLKGDYHYLMHQGTIFCNSEQVVRIYLPSDFHWKRLNAVAAASCIGTGNDAWDKPEPLVSFWAEVTAIASDSSWVDFYASTRQNKNGSILTQHKGIKFAYWISA